MSEETTVTVRPAEPRPAVVVPSSEAPGAEARDWFAGAVPGARPAFRSKQKIGMD